MADNLSIESDSRGGAVQIYDVRSLEDLEFVRDMLIAGYQIRPRFHGIRYEQQNTRRIKSGMRAKLQVAFTGVMERAYALQKYGKPNAGKLNEDDRAAIELDFPDCGSHAFVVDATRAINALVDVATSDREITFDKPSLIETIVANLPQPKSENSYTWSRAVSDMWSNTTPGVQYAGIGIVGAVSLAFLFTTGGGLHELLLRADAILHPIEQLKFAKMDRETVIGKDRHHSVPPEPVQATLRHEREIEQKQVKKFLVSDGPEGPLLHFTVNEFSKAMKATVRSADGEPFKINGRVIDVSQLKKLKAKAGRIAPGWITTITKA